MTTATAAPAKAASNSVAIAKFFEMTTREAAAALKTLTSQDKDQLGEGIRNGTLTYA